MSDPESLHGIATKKVKNKDNISANNFTQQNYEINFVKTKNNFKVIFSEPVHDFCQ